MNVLLSPSVSLVPQYANQCVRSRCANPNADVMDRVRVLATAGRGLCVLRLVLLNSEQCVIVLSIALLLRNAILVSLVVHLSASLKSVALRNDDVLPSANPDAKMNAIMVGVQEVEALGARPEAETAAHQVVIVPARHQEGHRDQVEVGGVTVILNVNAPIIDQLII